MSADFAPSLHYGASGIGAFRFWCQKTLPLVYDDSLSYYELLCKVVELVKDIGEDMHSLDEAYIQLQDYVNNYFDNLDVTEEINAKLDAMAEGGSLGNLISHYITRNIDVAIITASYGDPDVMGYANTFLHRTQYRIEQYTGAKCYIGYQRSASFSGHLTDELGNGITFDPALEMVLNEITTRGGDPTTVGQVMIVGSGNDNGATRTEISNGMAHLCSLIKANFPNAIIRFAYTSWRINGPAKRYIELNNLITLFKELCPRHGIGYCTNSEYIFHQYYPSWYLEGSRIHPSETGAMYIADGIVQCILTGSCSCVKQEVMTATATEDETANPFIVRPQSTQTETHYQFQYLTDFVVRQENENTYIIPSNSVSGSAPTCQLNSGFMLEFGTDSHDMTPIIFGYTQSNLFKCIGTSNYFGTFPVTIVVTDSTGTICNTVKGFGKIFSRWENDEYVPVLWVGATKDSSYYPCGTGGRAKVYIQTIVLPTAYC